MMWVPYHYYKAKLRKLWSIISDLRKELEYARYLINNSNMLKQRIVRFSLPVNSVRLKGSHWTQMDIAGFGSDNSGIIHTQVRDSIRGLVIQDIRQNTGTDENRWVR